MQAKVRKYLLVVETTAREMGRELAKPTRKAVALAVIAIRSQAATPMTSRS